MFNMVGSKRRSQLGVGVADWGSGGSWYLSNLLSRCVQANLPDTLFGTGCVTRRNPQALLRRSKEFLAMRSVDDLSEEEKKRLDQRYPWNKLCPPENLLDYFTALKYSYSSPLPSSCGEVDLVVSENGKGRVAGIARSHSIWLDPVDAPKELYKYRLRIDDCIAWAYDNGFVPIMVTFTIFHRWHNLRSLLSVLKKSWSSMFSGSKWRSCADLLGLHDYIRRLEITINDGDVDLETGELVWNSGWHPHFHAIWFVPKDNLELLSDMESEWRKVWSECVQKQFKKEFGEEIDSSYLPAFEEHGLWFSRYSKGKDKGKLRHVKDSQYLAKIMGYDSHEVYGGDTELTTTTLKNSKVPFDLLLEVTAANVDLWCEYAMATKGVAAFTFAKNFERKTVAKYFKQNPSLKRASKKCPAEKLVGTIKQELLQLIYRNSLYLMLLKKISEGYDALCSWLNQLYVDFGVPELRDCPLALPRPPN